MSNRGTALLEPGILSMRDSSLLEEVLEEDGNSEVKSIVSLLSTTRTSESLEEVLVELEAGD